MKIKKNDINCSLEKSESKSCRANETFRDTLNRIEKQIDIECFYQNERDLVRELFLIIAEVYRLSPSDRVKVDGQIYPAADVATVFEMLTADHIRQVIEKNNERKYPVKYRKAYLRTLLYNSVFEYSSATLEDF